MKRSFKPQPSSNYDQPNPRKVTSLPFKLLVGYLVIFYIANYSAKCVREHLAEQKVLYQGSKICLDRKGLSSMSETNRVFIIKCTDDSVIYINSEYLYEFPGTCTK